MGMPWRLIDSPAAPAARNMAVDEAILVAVSRGEAPPTLRLYAWDPPAVSVGYFQRLDREVDREVCRQLGVQWVRRPTGGRAVLHEREITYSVVAPLEVLGGSVLTTYCEISRGLVAGLRLLGVEAEIVPAARSPRGLRSGACFDAPSWYEVVVGGRKLVGSAQVRRDGALLQHGSVLLEFNPRRVAAVLRLPPAARERLARLLAAGATGLSEVLGRCPGEGEVRAALSRGFQEALGWDLEPGELTAGERELVARLEEKYNSDAWNLARGEVNV